MTVPMIFITPSKKREPLDRASLLAVMEDARPSPRRVVARYLATVWTR